MCACVYVCVVYVCGVYVCVWCMCVCVCVVCVGVCAFVVCVCVLIWLFIPPYQKGGDGKNIYLIPYEVRKFYVTININFIIAG
jgi:hypothetical protein